MRPVQSLFLHLANLISALLPQTRMFAIRRIIYRTAGIRISRNSRLNGGVVFQHNNVIIGPDTWVGRRTEFAATSRAAITIGANCAVSQDVLFIAGSHQIGGPTRRAGLGSSSPIQIGNGTWIGARATFLGGSKVGEGCVVAACSLVRGEFPAHTLIAGIPARIVRKLDERHSDHT